MSRLNKYFQQYLSAKVIFAIDLVLSIIASAIVVLTLAFFAKSGSNYYRGVFSLWWLISSVVGTIAGMLLFKSYNVVVRHTTLRDLLNYILALSVKVILIGLVVGFVCIFNASVIIALVLDFLLSLFLMICVRLVMFWVYDMYKRKFKELSNRQRVLVFSTSDKSAAVVTRLENSPHYKVVGFITRDDKSKNLRINDLPVFVCHTDQQVEKVLDKLSVRSILFTTEADVMSENTSLVEYCNQHNVKTLIIPTIDNLEGGNQILRERVREVKIEDLLGRQEIKISMDEIIANFKDKVVMVTGAAGSIGSELCRQLATFGIKQLVLFDNAETPMHNLRLELEQRFPRLDFVPIIGDVRHPDRLDYAFRKWHPQVVFHAAAYKHVPLMEENPCEAVLVNVFGSCNVADKCMEYGVEKMVMISTDKAVNPTNIMGCSKRLAEIYVQSLGLAVEQGKVVGNTKFVTTRFGNVLGSNGSVIPRFREQIANGGPVTVTHPEITRFFMTIPEACRLVMEAATMSSGNQIFVFDMGESIKIDTLARRMITLAGLKVGEDIEIQYIGLRPGEKLYEEVLSNKENTLPTSHDRIRIAKVREYKYDEMKQVLNELVNLAHNVEIPEMVILMKKTVPEFISKNSRFEEYDRR
ncbi:MAG: polysaccharide biosynthesis protein [Bacteroidales bacterium]|nr:polysaccharide biosynthesis protein [Bacteroidales bacterium]